MTARPHCLRCGGNVTLDPVTRGGQFLDARGCQWIPTCMLCGETDLPDGIAQQLGLRPIQWLRFYFLSDTKTCPAGHVGEYKLNQLRVPFCRACRSHSGRLGAAKARAALSRKGRS